MIRGSRRTHIQLISAEKIMPKPARKGDKSEDADPTGLTAVISYERSVARTDKTIALGIFT